MNCVCLFSRNALEEEVYQKCCGISPDYKFLVTGGTDGYLRVWSLPDMKKEKQIKAHEKEVDVLDIKPDCKQVHFLISSDM